MEEMSHITIGAALLTAGFTAAIASLVSGFRYGWSTVIVIGVMTGVAIVVIGFILTTESLMPLPARILIGISIFTGVSGIIWTIHDRLMATGYITKQQLSEKDVNVMAKTSATTDPQRDESKTSASIAQTMTNSPGGIQATGNVVVGAPIDRFVPPSEGIVKAAGAALAEFKIAYPTARVYIQVESGSSPRRQVGIVLGKMVVGIGQFNDGTYIGNFPGPGATLLCGDKKVAQGFLAAISSYLSGDIEVIENNGFESNLKLHLNGNPSFSPTGAVDIR